MIESISRLGGFLDVVWDFFFGAIKWFVYIIDFATTSITMPVALQPFLPSFLGSMVAIVTVLAVVKAIFGR